jgi:integrase
MKFTDKYLQSIKQPEKEYYVREGGGFTLRVFVSGARTFHYIYTFSGKRQRLNLGQYPQTSLAEARQKYLEAAALVSKGIDPKCNQVLDFVAEFDNLTVEGLAKLYLAHIEGHLVARSVKHQTRSLTKDVLPVIGLKPVEEIRRRDAIMLIETIAKRAPGQARNVLLHTRAMFSYALHREMVEYNPFSVVSAAVPMVKAKSRARWLSIEEIKFVWNSLWSGQETAFIRRAILLILVTAQRPNEVLNIHSDEVEIGVGKPRCAQCRGCGWWTKPPEKTKNKDSEHRVYLTRLALHLLLPLEGNFFPAGRGADGTIRVNSLDHHISYTLTPKYLGLPRWTPHDLRRTVSSHLGSMKAPDVVIDLLQDHKRKGMAAIYDRFQYDPEKAEWLTIWSDRLIELLDFKLD